jgi:hypothetical protein
MRAQKSISSAHDITCPIAAAARRATYFALGQILDEIRQFERVKSVQTFARLLTPRGGEVCEGRHNTITGYEGREVGPIDVNLGCL